MILFQCNPFVIDCLISLLDDLPTAGFLYVLPPLDMLEEDPIVVILRRLLLAAISACSKIVADQDRGIRKNQYHVN